MTIDVNKIKEEAEKEVAEEQAKLAKDKIKSLLRRKADAQKILANIDAEIADAYASIGQGS